MYLKDLLTATRGRNLVTYASSLLDSDYKEDYESGARILVVFIGKQKLPVEELIRSSRKRIQKLVMMLSWTDRDYQDTRLFAAKIVAHVALHISIAQFPGTLESIRSLLKPSESNSILFGTPLKSKPTTEEVRSGTEHTVQTKPATEYDADARMECQLIEQGLIILDQLSLDRTNCSEILKAEPLLMDILSWICSRPFIHDNEQEGEWVNILRLSFTVLAQLASLRGQLALKLLRKIKFEFNPSWVSGYACQPDIQILAIKTFSYVFTATAEDSSDAPEIKKLATTETSQQALPRGKSEKGKKWDKREHFLKVILMLFLPNENIEQGGTSSMALPTVQSEAGEALTMLSLSSRNCKYLLDLKEGMALTKLEQIIYSEDRIEYRAIAADILKRLYAVLCDPDLYPNEQKFPHIERVLPKSDKQHLRLQAALIRIICDMQSNEKISGSEFSRLVGNRSHFAKLLKKLIVTNSRAGTDYHLEIVKWTAALIGSMLTRDRVWAQEIRKQGIVESLSDASKIMSGADSWMLYFVIIHTELSGLLAWLLLCKRYRIN
ncbi:hypothetical protein GQ55_8G178400 [Panicum hallii var. hallii]|uniref:Uncharacterized protein n=1 Tax=Panicum hallii var. hallii TaxID=1504633 RepID=A0A2T7CNN3_9POAL|nr:hypothetical protein GQ55_8G178400 [Panicum hallii var. hallii]